MPGCTTSEGAPAAYNPGFFEGGCRQRVLQRTQKSEALVGAVVFLASSESDFSTGATILVDGGHYRYEQTRACVSGKNAGGEL
jgi:NAD(P)-dependent dehydrogenase (short-subunit alcohol dehydrogenase family)